MKIRIKFAKQGAMKFIGHLDVMRYFQKAMRRADVDIRYSEGFSPHQIMSFAAPLGVGLTSGGEYMDIEVLSTGSSAGMAARLNEVMVEGMKVLKYLRLPDGAAGGMSLVAACDYTVRVREGQEGALFGRINCPVSCPEEFFRKLVDFLCSEDLNVIKKTKKGEKQMDLKPLIYEAAADGPSVFLKLAAGSTDNVKPELVLEAFSKWLGCEFPPFAFQINREEIYADEGIEGSHAFRPLEVYGEDIE